MGGTSPLIPRRPRIDSDIFDLAVLAELCTAQMEIAAAGLANAAIHANTGDPPGILFGVQATVPPLTIWSGNPVPRLKLAVDPEGHGRPPENGRDLADRSDVLPSHLTASSSAPFTDRNRPD